MINKINLPNGVRIVHEHLDHVRSCAMGIWVQSGSRHERPELCGISHFIEHMLFKGTKTYTAAQLAEEFDTIGGQVNAFTTKENTCYYIRTLDTHFQTAAKLLGDMYFNSVMGEDEVNLERGVILEEIGMYEDTPEDLVNELLFEQAFKGSSLARPILGTKSTLDAIDGATLRAYLESSYTAKNTLVSISGSYSEQDIEFICRLFGGMRDCPPPLMQPAVYTPSTALKTKDIEQNHLMLVFPGLDITSPRRYTLQVMSNILGAGMSSRLFQKVREQSGLCYSIYSFSSLYQQAGIFGVYTALGKETEMQALELIRSELRGFTSGGVGKDELYRTKEQLKSNVLMGMESTTSRMSSNARNEIIFGRPVSEDEIVEALDAVTADGVHTLAAEILNFDALSFAAVGDVANEAAYMSVIKK